MGHYLSRLTKHVVPEVVEVGTYAAAGFGFGYLQNRYREKASVRGVPVDLLAGATAKVAVIAASVMGARGMIAKVAPHLDRVGNAALTCYFHTVGAGKGAAAAGVKRLLISSGDVQKAKTTFPNATILGAIPKAPHGNYLSSSELAAMAAR